MRLASRDGDGISYTNYGHRSCTGAYSTITELAIRVIAPALHCSIIKHSAAVKTACGDRPSRTDTGHGHRGRSTPQTFGTQLTVFVRPPALYGAAAEQGTAVAVS
jgi:hypothetical protein